MKTVAMVVMADIEIPIAIMVPTGKPVLMLRAGQVTDKADKYWLNQLKIFSSIHTNDKFRIQLCKQIYVPSYILLHIRLLALGYSDKLLATGCRHIASALINGAIIRIVQHVISF